MGEAKAHPCPFAGDGPDELWVVSLCGKECAELVGQFFPADQFDVVVLFEGRFAFEQSAFDAGHVRGSPGHDDVFNRALEFGGVGASGGGVDSGEDALVSKLEDVFPKQFLHVGVHGG